jgi:hypothetical protein
MAGAEGLDIGYWQQLCPELHITKDVATRSSGKPNTGVGKQKKEIVENGFFLTAKSDLSAKSTDVIQGLARAILLLNKAGWPATFILLFDEAWVVINDLSDQMKGSTGNATNFDILAWHVDPSDPALRHNFSPHRDRSPPDPTSTFRADKTPMYTSAWVALTGATTENSCLHVVPRQLDPAYMLRDSPDLDGDGEDSSKRDAVLDKTEDKSLKAATDKQEDFESLVWSYYAGVDKSKQTRAMVQPLPRAPGEAIFFSHRLMHWGSPGNPDCKDPRISLSVACASDEFEPSYLPRTHLPAPKPDLRLALAAAQMLCYFERFQVSRERADKFYHMFDKCSEHFHATYVQKVQKEYARAVAEKSKGGGEDEGEEAEEGIDEDELDAGFDAMLGEGEGDFGSEGSEGSEEGEEGEEQGGEGEREQEEQEQDQEDGGAGSHAKRQKTRR